MIFRLSGKVKLEGLFFKRAQWFRIQPIKSSPNMLLGWTPSPRMRNNTLNDSQCVYLTHISLRPSWLWLVFEKTNHPIFPAASVGGYWYGPGEAACQLLLNNVTPLSHFHNTQNTHRYLCQIQMAEALMRSCCASGVTKRAAASHLQHLQQQWTYSSAEFTATSAHLLRTFREIMNKEKRSMW